MTALDAAPARRRSRLRRRRGAVALVVLTVLLALGAWAGGVRVVRVTSDSMAPGLGSGTRLITVPVDGADVRPGEVVVFTPTPAWRTAYAATTGVTDPPDLMIKRVLALGRDTLECCAADGNLVRNGDRLDEPWLATDPGQANSATFRVVVPEGHVWLMGDNRTVSFDSRSMRRHSGEGFVPVSAIRARVLRAW